MDDDSNRQSPVQRGQGENRFNLGDVEKKIERIEKDILGNRHPELILDSVQTGLLICDRRSLPAPSSSAPSPTRTPQGYERDLRLDEKPVRLYTQHPEALSRALAYLYAQLVDPLSLTPEERTELARYLCEAYYDDIEDSITGIGWERPVNAHLNLVILAVRTFLEHLSSAAPGMFRMCRE